jgi:glutaminyl-peptide cyclotransferase
MQVGVGGMLAVRLKAASPTEMGQRPIRGGRSPLRAIAVVLALLLAGCGERIPSIEVEIVRVLPHDPGAYTQGLLLHEGRFFESTGTYGGSTLREVDPESGTVLRQVELPPDVFGEGLALVGDRLIQITWQEGVAYVWDLERFELLDTLRYDGTGWGLCFDGASLYMTTGGSLLQRRDPSTFEVLERIPLTRAGEPLFQLNELECVGDHIYGNIFQTDRIVRVDKRTGVVVGEADASVLNPQSGRPVGDPEAVLNGIAWNPGTGTFYLTGKRWPTMFEVRFR